MRGKTLFILGVGALLGGCFLGVQCDCTQSNITATFTEGDFIAFATAAQASWDGGSSQGECSNSVDSGDTDCESWLFPFTTGEEPASGRVVEFQLTVVGCGPWT